MAKHNKVIFHTPNGLAHVFLVGLLCWISQLQVVTEGPRCPLSSGLATLGFFLKCECSVKIKRILRSKIILRNCTFSKFCLGNSKCPVAYDRLWWVSEVEKLAGLLENGLLAMGFWTFGYGPCKLLISYSILWQIWVWLGWRNGMAKLFQVKPSN